MATGKLTIMVWFGHICINGLAADITIYFDAAF